MADYTSAISERVLPDWRDSGSDRRSDRSLLLDALSRKILQISRLHSSCVIADGRALAYIWASPELE